MVKNKKGQTMGLSILSALAILVVGFVLFQFLLPEVDTFRADMGCADASTLSDGGMLTCLGGDIIIPLIILGILSLAIWGIVSRLNI